MRHLLFSAIVLIVAQGVGAQVIRSFEFKGILATDRYEQHKAEFERCAKYANFNGCRFKNGMVAGTSVGPEAGWAEDGSLVLIRGNFADFQFTQIDAGFRQKWGKPSTFVEQQVQNGYGAIKSIPIAVWQFKEGEMTLIGPNFRGNGSFEFQTLARKAYMEGLDKPKADF